MKKIELITKYKILQLAVLIIPYTPTVNCTTLNVESGIWPPITDSKTPGYGYGAAVAIKALEEAGYAVSYKESPWKRVMHNLENKQTDIALAASFNKERSSKFIFSTPYIWEEVAVYFLTSRKPPENFTEISKGKIAIGRNYSFGEKIDEKIINKPLESNNIESMFNMLLSGRADFVIEYASVASQYIKNTPIEISAQIAQPCPLGQTPLYIMVRRNLKDAELLVEKFNIQIRKMMQDERYYLAIKYSVTLPTCSNYAN